MTSPFDSRSFVKHLQRLLYLKRRQEALDAIELAGAAGPHTSSVLRLKSRAHAGIGDTQSAYETLRQLATRSDNTGGDLYWAGQYATELGRYDEAEILLGLSIDRAKETKNHYYLECAMLLRAYVRIHLQKFSLARDDLNELEDDAYINWADRLGVISRAALLHQVSTTD